MAKIEHYKQYKHLTPFQKNITNIKIRTRNYWQGHVSCVKERKGFWQSVLCLKKKNTADKVSCVKNVYNIYNREIRLLAIFPIFHAPDSKSFYIYKYIYLYMYIYIYIYIIRIYVYVYIYIYIHIHIHIHMDIYIYLHMYIIYI